MEEGGCGWVMVCGDLSLGFWFGFEEELIYIYKLACHVTIYYYCNKTITLVSIFHPPLNDNDQIDTKMKC
jgi:hypothetical protein